MDEGRMRIVLTLGAVAALVFVFFLLKKLLGVMRFSAKAIVCLAAVAVIVAAIWSQRLPSESASERGSPLQLERVNFRN